MKNTLIITIAALSLNVGSAVADGFDGSFADVAPPCTRHIETFTLMYGLPGTRLNPDNQSVQEVAANACYERGLILAAVNPTAAKSPIGTMPYDVICQSSSCQAPIEGLLEIEGGKTPPENASAILIGPSHLSRNHRYGID